MPKVIVIGAGPAGMLAAAKASEAGNEVFLFEKNAKVGRKLLITGKGRCNLTNAKDTEGLMKNTPGNPKFLFSAYSAFGSGDTASLFNKLGVPTKVERGERVFPVSDKASDIVLAMEKNLKKAGVKLFLNTEVSGIIIENGYILGVYISGNKQFLSDAVIVATGGLSYPKTGSTGDGLRFAKLAGLNVTKTYPSLVPILIKESFCAEAMGLSLKNVGVILKDGKDKVIYKDFGEMLFTHFGVSGPVVLSLSRHIAGEENKNFKLIIDLKPALSEKTLDLRILRDFEKNVNRDFKNSLDELLPQKLIPVIISLSGIPPEKKVNNITKEERKKLIGVLKGLTLTVSGTRGFDEAIVTKGGIDVKEINPKTMESKKIKGLYFAGEVLDVDGYTGGYNLQIAFSTGFIAGKNV